METNTSHLRAAKVLVAMSTPAGDGDDDEDIDTTQATIRAVPRVGLTSSSTVPSSEDSAWETAQERGSRAEASSSAMANVLPHLSSSSSFSAAAPRNGHHHSSSSTNTRRLWAAVKTSAKLAAVPRKARAGDDASAVDEEGMSSQHEDLTDRARGRSSGAYLDQWASIAHYLEDEGEDEDGERHDQKKRSTSRDKKNKQQHQERRGRQSSAQLLADARPTSYTQEPESMLSSDITSIPRQEDPLAYKSDSSLLDTDDDDSDTAAGDYSTCTESIGEKQGFRAKLVAGLFLLARKRPTLFTKTVTKCVLAYFIASLFTYSTFLSHRMALLLPDHDHSKRVPISNLHLIATVAVYFHPGRSMGSMVEASIYAFAAFLYSIFIGFASMIVAVFLHDHNLPLTSNAITVVVFVGLAMALVGYAKVKIGKPNFNTACSLISVISFTVIVLEGSTHLGRFSTEKIWQVTLVVLVGVLISNAICFLIWPASACTGLQLDIRRNLESFSTLLKVLTKTFLLDDMKEFNIRSDRIKEAIDDHHASFTSLKKNLSEAKLEVPFDVRIRGRVGSYVRVVDSLNILAQHLSGLRSSCGLQHEIIVEQRARTKLLAKARGGGKAADGHMSLAVPASDSNLLNLNESDISLSASKDLDEKFVAFRHFLESVGPHMRSLVVSDLKKRAASLISRAEEISQFTCSRTLKGLTGAFAATRGTSLSDRRSIDPTESFEALRKDVSAALRRFQHEQTVAIKR